MSDEAPIAASTAARIQLVRHGQTIMNAQVRYRGRRDVPLNDVGRREAQDAANALVGAGISAIYSSPLGRALEVAAAIASTTHAGPTIALDDLVNLEYGRWEGLTKEECAADDPQEWARYTDDPERAVCPGGEALATAADRVMRALRTIGAAHQGESVAAVSHGIMLRFAVLRLRGLQDGVDWQFTMPTGGALVFDVGPDGTVELVVGPESFVSASV